MVGRCDGHCLGAPFGQGFGHGGRITGTHVTKAPYLRCGPSSSPDIDPKAAGDSREGCSAQVNGRLPPEAVQRVVRQSFGRLRACYESGLRRDPGLEGRIAVKFVIDRSGAVVMTSVTERSLPDAEVAACVARAYGAMSFPEPEGGIVTVVYPIIFGF